MATWRTFAKSLVWSLRSNAVADSSRKSWICDISDVSLIAEWIAARTNENSELFWALVQTPSEPLSRIQVKFTCMFLYSEVDPGSEDLLYEFDRVYVTFQIRGQYDELDGFECVFS